MAKSVKKSGAAPKAAAKTRKPSENKPSEKKTVASTNGSTNGNGSSLSHDQVAQLAHRFWNERGRVHGHHEEDWYRAEQALRSRAS
jgi:hypothetical protein